VDADGVEAEPEPVATERVGWPRRDRFEDGLSGPPHLLLDRQRDVPRGLLFLEDDDKLTERRLPVGASDRDRIVRLEPPIREIEEQTLRYVHEELALAEEWPRGDDVSVVDDDQIAGPEWRFERAAIARREHGRRDTDARADRGPRLFGRDHVYPFGAGQRRKRRLVLRADATERHRRQRHREGVKSDAFPTAAWRA
jgi:hypothetical protein